MTAESNRSSSDSTETFAFFPGFTHVFHEPGDWERRRDCMRVSPQAGLAAISDTLAR